MSIFRELIQAGQSLIEDMAGECVRYYRGDKFIDIKATPGDGQRKTNQSDVVLINGQRDWLVMVGNLDELGRNGEQILPARGDVIEIMIDLGGYSTPSGERYEVLPKDSDDVYTMATFSQYRIHSKLISRDF